MYKILLYNMLHESAMMVVEQTQGLLVPIFDHQLSLSTQALILSLGVKV